MSSLSPNFREVQSKEIIPFLKWVGGKRWYSESLKKEFSSFSGRYIEPFLGGGAIFFSMLPNRALLSVINSDLVHTYQILVSDWQKIVTRLEWHQIKHSSEHYYVQRSTVPRDDIERAARFIYLNRACWNGLYRVNFKGEFNVPKGSKVKILLETDNFKRIADALAKAKIQCLDFEEALQSAEKGDCVFLDPPYTVKHNLNGFVKYNEKLFSWSDQIRLRNAATQAARRGAIVIMMNANHESIRNLYRDFAEHEIVSRNSVLSAKSQFRGEVTELLLRITANNL